MLSVKRRTNGFSTGNGNTERLWWSGIKVILGSRCRVVWVGLEERVLLAENT